MTLHAERLRLLLDPGQVLLARRGVDDDAEEILGEEIDDEIVDDAAVRIEHARVERLAGDLQLVDAVREQVAQELARARAVQVDHGHVRDIEHAGVAAHLVMLLDLRAVVERHVPAAEVDHLGAGGAVGIVEDGLLGHGAGFRNRGRAL